MPVIEGDVFTQAKGTTEENIRVGNNDFIGTQAVGATIHVKVKGPEAKMTKKPRKAEKVGEDPPSLFRILRGVIADERTEPNGDMEKVQMAPAFHGVQIPQGGLLRQNEGKCLTDSIRDTKTFRKNICGSHGENAQWQLVFAGQMSDGSHGTISTTGNQNVRLPMAQSSKDLFLKGKGFVEPEKADLDLGTLLGNPREMRFQFTNTTGS